jgi:hypothetical protein
MTVGRVARRVVAGLVVRSSVGKVAGRVVRRSVGRAAGVTVAAGRAVEARVVCEVPNCISPHRH